VRVTDVGIRVKRAYDAASPRDGKRYLVDRLWPRGLCKESLRIDGWLRDVSPSPALREWFAHDPEKWPEFQRRYRAELDARPDGLAVLLEAARTGTVTLLFSARDVERNSAVLLAEYLKENQR